MSTHYITESVIREHHVSKDYFTPFIGRILSSSLFVSDIPSEGTTLDKGPSGLGKEDLRFNVKYFKIPTDIAHVAP